MHLRGIPITTNSRSYNSPRRLAGVFTSAGLLIVLAAAPLEASSILVPNYSFEEPVATLGVTPKIDSWQEAPNPGYPESPQFTWDQATGLFFDTNPYGFGNQAAYILSFPGAGFFQDYDSLDWDDGAPAHAFDQTFEIGQAYQLTIGVYGKSRTPGSGMVGSTLVLSLYYRDANDARISVGSTTVTFTDALFPNQGPLSLLDVVVDVPTVLATDVWAGEYLGIEIQSGLGTGDGYWDIDNVRLTETPEPTTAGLLALGVGGLLFKRPRKPGQA